MATKKQKRAAALAKREAFLAQVEAEGLEAQRRDRERRAKEYEQFMQKARTLNEIHAAVLAKHGIFHEKENEN